MTLVDTIKAAARKLTAATTSIHDEIAKLREAIVATRTEAANVRAVPRPVEEILRDRIPAAVAEAGAWWLREHGSSLIRGQQSLGAPDWNGSVSLPWNFRDPLPWPALCAGLPDLAAEFLGNLVRAVPYEAGPPAAERPALAARLERELAELEAAEERLIDEAAAAGVVIAHRTEVVQRRAAEARKRELAEAADRDAAARQAALDAAHAERAATRGVVPSPYLQREARAKDRA